MIRKVIVKSVDNNNNYILVDDNNKYYAKNIEFYTKVKPQVNDIMYFSDRILRVSDLYAFGEVYDTKNYNVDDFMKLISNNEAYYFQQLYG